MNLKDRMLSAGPIWKRMVKRNKTFVRQTAIAGGSAGSHSVSGVLAGDKLVSVIEVEATSGALTDRTAEFGGVGYVIDADGAIDNTGGTDTTGDSLLVTWESYTES